MNRIFYDSISDLPSGGGEQGAFDLKSRSAELFPQYDNSNHMVNMDWARKHGERLATEYFRSRQSEIDSLREELATKEEMSWNWQDGYNKATEENAALRKEIDSLKEQNQKLYSALHSLAYQYKEEIRMNFPRDDPKHRWGDELDEWVSDLPAYEAAKALLNQQPG